MACYITNARRCYNEGVHIECLGNARNQRFKSKFSVLPTSMSVTTGGSVSQLCHAGEAKFQVRGGQSTYGKNKGSVTAISEVTTSQILTSRILGLTLMLSTNNIFRALCRGSILGYDEVILAIRMIL